MHKLFIANKKQKKPWSTLIITHLIAMVAENHAQFLQIIMFKKGNHRSTFTFHWSFPWKARHSNDKSQIYNPAWKFSSSNVELKVMTTWRSWKNCCSLSNTKNLISRDGRTGSAGKKTVTFYVDIQWHPSFRTDNSWLLHTVGSSYCQLDRAYSQPRSQSPLSTFWK